MLKATCLMLVLFVLAGCETLVPPRPDTREKQNPEVLLKNAESQRSGGNLAEARELLVTAKNRFPEHKGIREALDRTEKELLRRRQELDDKLLLVRAESLRQELPLLESLRKTDPEDRMTKARSEQARAELNRSADNLSACGKRQERIHPEIAARCLKTALAIRENPNDRQLLEHISERRQQAAKIRNQAEQEQEEIIETQTNLEQARKFIEKGDYFEALQILDQLLSRHPGLVEAQELLFQIQAFLEEYSMTLVSTGDTLYREGRIESAISSWQAALKLYPDNEQAAKKLERAQRVLENLEQLRKEQTQTTTP